MCCLLFKKTNRDSITVRLKSHNSVLHIYTLIYNLDIFKYKPELRVIKSYFSSAMYSLLKDYEFAALGAETFGPWSAEVKYFYIGPVVTSGDPRAGAY